MPNFQTFYEKAKFETISAAAQKIGESKNPYKNKIKKAPKRRGRKTAELCLIDLLTQPRNCDRSIQTFTRLLSFMHGSDQ
jgi:hypothetical protein